MIPSANYSKAAKPARYVTPGDGAMFSWVYGEGSYSSMQGIAAITLQDLPFLRELAPSLDPSAKSTTVAETPAKRAELQLKAKEADFIKQRLERGVIEESPLTRKISKTTETKEYVIESPKRNADGVPISEGRVTTIEKMAEASKSTLELDAQGNTRTVIACFAAGTPVHTDKGLLPVEQVRVGTRVLSQPENGGKQDWRPVLNTVATLDQQVYAVQVKVAGATTLTTIIATPNHPFWVEGPLVDGKHWMAAECLKLGFVLQLADGNKATVHAAGLIRHTQRASIGFAADKTAGVGMVIDLSNGQVKLASDPHSLDLGELQLGEPVLTPVYNFEVEEFHTYYVGEVGVWVHNTNCSKLEIAGTIGDLADYRAACFSVDTMVHVRAPAGNIGKCEIDLLSVGAEVLSRCEKTGETAYKKVLKVFERRADEVFNLWYEIDPAHSREVSRPSYPGNPVYPNPTPGNQGVVSVTAEHPFWVVGKGWTEVRKLQPGDEFVTQSGVWAKFVKLVATHRGIVYNIEVEDFNTYFIEEEGIWVHNCNGVKGIDGKPIEIKVDFVNTNKYPDAKPVGPLSRTVAEVDRMWEAGEIPGGELKYKSMRGEAEAQSILAKSGYETAALPESALNELGREERKHPDISISSKTPGDVLHGSAADIFTPTATNPKPASIALTVWSKSESQASVVVVNLKSTQGVKVAEVLAEVNKVTAEGTPPPGLRVLLIIDESGQLIRTDYPLTASKSNAPVYGTVTITADGNVIAKKLPQQPSSDTRIFRTQNQRVLHEGNGGATLIALADVNALLPTARQYWINAGASAALLDQAVFNIGTLAPRLAAMTLGNEITLSSDGAGWGWFVDSSPAAQEEFLSSAGSAFEAKPNDAAEGKLDLLTVMVHELGHVLGLEHTASGGDVMAQYIAPGARRIPGAADAAALVQRQPIALNPQVVSTTYTTLAPNVTANPWQPPQAVNPTLMGGLFTDAIAGWQTAGNVSLDGLGGVTLDESTQRNAHSRNLGELQLGEPVLTPVYNLEVEEFHTYYVGEHGVWVHNTNCSKTEVVKALFDAADYKNACFAGDTIVNVRGGNGLLTIERIRVGTEVLSRCEVTGEVSKFAVTLKTPRLFCGVYSKAKRGTIHKPDAKGRVDQAWHRNKCCH